MSDSTSLAAASRNLKTAFLAVVLLAATAYALWIFVLQFRAQEPARMAAHEALSSDEMMKRIGQPIKVGPFIRGSLVSNNGSGIADLIIPVRGPRGKGMLREWAQESSGKWRICSLTFRSNANSTEVVIIPDAKSNCERE
jgi:Cytochrome oxidase complex assembly protein 1